MKCSECGQQYNRKTGTPVGAVHITVYSLVVVVIFGAILFALFG